MANDQKLTDLNKKRSPSASRSSEIASIPKIVLEERKEPSSLPHPGSPNVMTTAASGGSAAPAARQAVSHGGSQTCPVTTAHMPLRSSSDIGLPAASMPNLALTLAGGGDPSASENYLEVFCSPRTFRRSVDLDVNSREHNRGQFEWVDSLDSSSNCLKVLTASSRVGSSISLNSECTARSVGLLSNDSDSDNDVSWSESEKLPVKPSQLRRFMSYPEEGASHELCARPSQSLSNIRTADNGEAIQNTESSSSVSDPTRPSSGPGDVNRLTKTCESVTLSSPRPSDSRQSSPGEERLQDKVRHAHKEGLHGRDHGRSGSSRPTHMLSYRCDTNDSTRDGRIRQWLQDMDSNG